MAHSFIRAILFFEIVQRIYSLFSDSTKAWKILLDNSKSETESLVNTLGSFEFLLGMVIWYEILFAINIVSKKLQSKSMCIDNTIKQLEGVLSYSEKYREENFTSSMNIAKIIALDMNVEFTLPTKRRKKEQFDENNQKDEKSQSSDELFRVDYFLVIVNMSITSLKSRFEQLKTFEIKLLDEKELRKCCATFHSTVSHGDSLDIDLNDFFSKLKNFLTVPVTVTLAKRSFSKLKLIKTYLRSSMSQERLNGLAILSIENDFL
ncbi:hypothetical protein ES332_A05G400100v1 [Gossypium tomentosum]|uniref:HAT C-terminal dimerisation domain-containing protein n=1 Tax=Gossypium tomentosum TaxID=34277 RepID=A0A5D2QPQ3_GOSTO|nr:hypothetical protein ES332_A05G400100v1 [Gossypium tomentosum]